mmetsp:Transcript_24097/g.57393  ORF Transcript_24097/g.57393 Transcript_24097/m.57393 type:complete len:297 (+) Transcript_24097:1341-2231(+)
MSGRGRRRCCCRCCRPSMLGASGRARAPLSRGSRPPRAPSTCGAWGCRRPPRPPGGSGCPAGRLRPERRPTARPPRRPCGCRGWQPWRSRPPRAPACGGAPGAWAWRRERQRHSSRPSAGLWAPSGGPSRPLQTPARRGKPPRRGPSPAGSRIRLRTPRRRWRQTPLERSSRTGSTQSGGSWRLGPAAQRPCRRRRRPPEKPEMPPCPAAPRAASLLGPGWRPSRRPRPRMGTSAPSGAQSSPGVPTRRRDRGPRARRGGGRSAAVGPAPPPPPRQSPAATKGSAARGPWCGRSGR